MKRRDEYLICKRDGRREHLRASKLARSIDRAFGGAAPTPWFAVEAATAVLGAARRGSEPLSTRELSAAVVGWLEQHGHREAARRYAEAGARARQRAELIASRGGAILVAPRLPALGGGRPADPRLN